MSLTLASYDDHDVESTTDYDNDHVVESVGLKREWEVSYMRRISTSTLVLWYSSTVVF